MGHLYALFILVVLASCGSDDSSTATQTKSKTPPPPFALEGPITSPGNDSTPTLRASGVKVGSIVTLHKDPSCDTQTSEPVKVENPDFVLVTSYDLSRDTSGYGEVTFYAAVKESEDSDPVCLNTGVSYAFDLIVPDAPGALALEDPSTSPSANPTPTLNVSGVEPEAVVTLYSDDSCNTQVSDGVQVLSGESAVSITTKSLGDGARDVTTTLFADQRDKAGNKSPCSSMSISYVLDVTAPEAPTALVLEGPETSPNINPTPIVKVSGVEERAMVTLYKDSSCEMQISDGVIVEWGESEVSITSYSLGDGSQDVEVSFYALQRDRAGNRSPCSIASVSYIADLAAPMAPTALSLSKPSTSPGVNPTPTLLIEGVEEGASVTLYSDSACTSAMSSTLRVAAGQTDILITSHHLGSADMTVDYYSAQVDLFGRSSECSTASVSYGFTLPSLFLSVEAGSYFYDDPSGDTLEITATFEEVVNVVGTPRIELILGTATKYATYDSGSGTSTLVFSYDVSSDDYDNDGIQMATTIDLGGGTIQDSSTQNVPLNFMPPHNLGRVWINFREKIFSIRNFGQGAFAFLKKGGSVVTWGDSSYGGNSESVSSDLTQGVVEIFSNYGAFAALKEDGSVVTWGNIRYGADPGNISSDLQRGVKKIFSNSYYSGDVGSFAALKEDGSVVTWGGGIYGRYGGNSNSVSSDLRDNVVEIFSTDYAFAALKENGSVITWGDGSYGGNSGSVSSDLRENVVEIFSTDYAFAALKENRSVITWGDGSYGGNSGSVSSDLDERVVEIFSTWSAFAALKDDGSVITWGNSNFGGDSSNISLDLQGGVSKIFSASGGAFAALKENGSVVVWGNGSRGGNRGNVSSDLERDVVEIFSTSQAFAALKENGSVITWGSSGYGGDSSNVSSDLNEGVMEIFSNSAAFAVLKEDGSVITWGSSGHGGDSSNVSSDLNEGVMEIFSNSAAFAVLKEDGSVITWGNSNFGGASSGIDLGPRW